MVKERCASVLGATNWRASLMVDADAICNDMATMPRGVIEPQALCSSCRPQTWGLHPPGEADSRFVHGFIYHQHPLIELCTIFHWDHFLEVESP